MAEKLPLIVGGVQLGHMVERDSYATDLIPVKTQSIKTLDGVEHFDILGYRGVLTVRLNPQKLSDLSVFIRAFLPGKVEVTYFQQQLNRELTDIMVLSENSAKYLSRCLAGRAKWAEMDAVTIEGVRVFEGSKL